MSQKVSPSCQKKETKKVSKSGKSGSVFVSIVSFLSLFLSFIHTPSLFSTCYKSLYTNKNCLWMWMPECRWCFVMSWHKRPNLTYQYNSHPNHASRPFLVYPISIQDRDAHTRIRFIDPISIIFSGPYHNGHKFLNLEWLTAIYLEFARTWILIHRQGQNHYYALSFCLHDQRPLDLFIAYCKFIYFCILDNFFFYSKVESVASNFQAEIREEGGGGGCYFYLLQQKSFLVAHSQRVIIVMKFELNEIERRRKF